MLTQICQYLRNWFNKNEPSLVGTFIIDSGGNVEYAGADASTYFKTGQYVRIIGSTFNDGVHSWNSDTLTPETFTGAIWGMAIPQAVLDIADDISEWNEKYGDAVDSPYNSESFGGYSYTKSSGNGGSGASGAVSWQNQFASRLAPWRKI